MTWRQALATIALLVLLFAGLVARHEVRPPVSPVPHEQIGIIQHEQMGK